MTNPAAAQADTPQQIHAADGYSLGARVFGSLTQARAVVLIHGAMAVPQRYYAAFSNYLARRGFLAISYDYRGVGASRPMALSGFEASARDWAELDARAAMGFAQRLAGPRPLFSVGHSFGGQITGLIDEARQVDAAVMVGVQLGYYRMFSAAMQARLLGSFGVLLPLVSGLWGYAPGRFGLGEDLPKGVAEEWSKWCLSPGYLRDHVADASARFARFDRPTLLFSFSDDDYAPKATVDAMVWALASAPLIHRRFAPSDLQARSVGHFGFFRRQREDLWREVVDHLDAHIAGNASPLRSREPHSFDLFSEDIQADLEFGRS
ncbi:MAG TPA: alpha/beta fold hydrolase [Polyangiaceae bacterium]|nr:alpha/beta fold hydrolase [Polyangiaceae bacterium]